MESRETRSRVLKGGTIIQGSGRSEITCLLRNQSSAGAELKLAADVQLPAAFQLYVATDGVAYDCILRWRKNDRAGVEFVGKGPKPKLTMGDERSVSKACRGFAQSA